MPTIDEMKLDLERLGWKGFGGHMAWQSPDGRLYRGPASGLAYCDRKKMGVKIELGEDGRVPEEVMKILHCFAAHRDICDQCGQAYAKAARAEAYCRTGYELLAELGKHESVSEQ